MRKISPQLAKQYVEWFKKNEPFWFRVAIKREKLKSSSAKNIMHGLGAFSWGGVFDTVVTTIKDVAPTYLQAKQQKEVMEMQLKRAEKGLPPANIDDYMPSVKISPTITPETEKAITRVAVESTKSGVEKILPWVAGIGAGALLLLATR